MGSGGGETQAGFWLMDGIGLGGTTEEQWPEAETMFDIFDSL